MTNDEKIDGLDAIIEDLIEWELEDMDKEELASRYFTTKKEYYKDNPEALEDMLEYRRQYEDTEIVLDEEARELARQQDNDISIDVSWDISKAPIEFKNPKLDIGD